MQHENVAMPVRMPLRTEKQRLTAVALASVCAFALLTTAPLAAQTVPTKDQLEPFSKAETPRRGRLDVVGDVERAPCALADPAYAGIKLKLTAATFNNLGPVAVADLTQTYARFIGTEQSIAVVCEIRDAAATLLRNRGYIAAVQVPTQRIEEGIVAFEVLYAKVTTIRVLGTPGRDEKLLEAYLNHLANGDVFNRFVAERYLLLARDLPGYDVRMTLKPAGTGAGEMIGEITLQHIPVNADFNVQNYASHSTGRIGAQLRAQFNGLTGMGDRTTISAYSTIDFKEQQIVQLGHDMHLGGEGLRLGGKITYAWTKPTLAAGLPAVEAKTLYLTTEAAYPFIRSQAASLKGAVGIDIVNQGVTFAGLPLSRDRLRVGYVRLDAEAIDLKGVGPGGTIGWRLSGALEVRRGLDLFGASPNCLTNLAICSAAGFTPPSLPDGDPQATMIRLGGTAEVRLARNVVWTFSPRAQWSNGPVFAFDQFSTGNYTVGRGFDPGIVAGDRGIGFQAEIRLEDFKLSPQSKVVLQPFAFTDNAWVWNRNGPSYDRARLSSAGGGLRLNWGGRARLEAVVAVPLSTLPGETQRRDPRVLLSLTTNILPWGTR